jgi:protein-L-isoaspartate(D-aspartate) O-methyltransferase
MVELIDIHFDLLSEEIGHARIGSRLRAALLEVPRHLFLPLELAAVAYQDRPLPIGFDKTISQPVIAALMMDLLDVQPLPARAPCLEHRHRRGVRRDRADAHGCAGL